MPISLLLIYNIGIGVFSLFLCIIKINQIIIRQLCSLQQWLLLRKYWMNDRYELQSRRHFGSIILIQKKSNQVYRILKNFLLQFQKHWKNEASILFIFQNMQQYVYDLQNYQKYQILQQKSKIIKNQLAIKLSCPRSLSILIGQLTIHLFHLTGVQILYISSPPQYLQNIFFRIELGIFWITLDLAFFLELQRTAKIHNRMKLFNNFSEFHSKISDFIMLELNKNLNCSSFTYKIQLNNFTLILIIFTILKKVNNLFQYKSVSFVKYSQSDLFKILKQYMVGIDIHGGSSKYSKIYKDILKSYALYHNITCQKNMQSLYYSEYLLINIITEKQFPQQILDLRRFKLPYL
ncbi:hypothetical protein pb186bvf_006446 [Paramecium bursaria]